MPTVLRIDGYRFFFYSNEGVEPYHIHVSSGDCAAKYWIDPVALADNIGFRAPELNKIKIIVIQHRETFKEAWNEHFSEKNQ
ncbi:DUF4160 domain-containing protein (plasmid) [Acetobacteraceae bacterium]|nr:DUF4160 domain-containing protein [Acetobacteraceae bacterium]